MVGYGKQKTGRKVKANNLSLSTDPKLMNHHFHHINTDPQYSTPEPLLIPEGTSIPVVDVSMVENFMMKQKSSAPGPDGIPYWIWRDYVQYLVPIIARILNFSLSQQYIPSNWKLANIAPIPKESPVTECSQLRPISLTNIIMRILEKIVFKQEIYPLVKKVIDDDQFAYKEGTSTTTALIKCQHNWLKWLDDDADYVRVIFFYLVKLLRLLQLPPPIDGIRRKKWMKLLGVKFQDDPCCWDLHVDELLSKASGRMYILRVCKSYGYASDQLTKLFETLILSLFTYAIEVWGSALLKKYLKRIDQFFRRARRYGYTTKEYEMSSLIEETDRALFRKITKDTEHVLYDLLPEMKQRTLRTQNHNYILPQIKTERFKRCFVNRCLFNNF